MLIHDRQIYQGQLYERVGFCPHVCRDGRETRTGGLAVELCDVRRAVRVLSPRGFPEAVRTVPTLCGTQGTRREGSAARPREGERMSNKLTTKRRPGCDPTAHSEQEIYPMPGKPTTTPKSWRDQIKVRPAADLFPDEQRRRTPGIGRGHRENGLRFPVVLWSKAITPAPNLAASRLIRTTSFLTAAIASTRRSSSASPSA